MIIRIPYKFSRLEGSSLHKPKSCTTKLCEKAMSGARLNRQEKDRLAEICYGTFGEGLPIYKWAGWAWVLSDCLQRFFVEFTYSDRTAQEYYAGDKTALRHVLKNVKAIHPVKKV